MKKIFLRHDPKVPFTKEGHEKLLAEKAKLAAERPEAVMSLAKSRELGDLSENGYYKAARAKLSALDANIRRVERLVKAAVIVNTTGADRVEIGTTVIIGNEVGKQTISIVGSYESDPMHHTISHISPIGKALMGKKVGDTVEVIAPAGVKIFTIESIT